MVDRLQLLNLQHNRIASIQHLAHLQSLVLLNLSHNSLCGMAGLEHLRSLRVLLLGRNRWVQDTAGPSPSGPGPTLRPVPHTETFRCAVDL